jgi:hypothetical protein
MSRAEVCGSRERTVSQSGLRYHHKRRRCSRRYALTCGQNPEPAIEELTNHHDSMGNAKTTFKRHSSIPLYPITLKVLSPKTRVCADTFDS